MLVPPVSMAIYHTPLVTLAVVGHISYSTCYPGSGWPYTILHLLPWQWLAIYTGDRVGHMGKSWNFILDFPGLEKFVNCDLVVGIFV